MPDVLEPMRAINRAAGATRLMVTHNLVMAQ